ncbi:MAG: hypothetical protein ACRDJV_12970 [Actinomycetota bacterium]
MLLVHGATTTGLNVEMLFLATGLLVLGIVLFVQKSVKPAVPVILIVGAFAAGAGALALSDDHRHAGIGGAMAGAPPAGLDVSIAAPQDGATIASGERVTIEVEVRGGELVQATSSDNPSAGHLHIFVDGRLETMISRSSTTVELESGSHMIRAEFTTADHRSFDPSVTDTVTVTAE